MLQTRLCLKASVEWNQGRCISWKPTWICKTWMKCILLVTMSSCANKTDFLNCAHTCTEVELYTTVLTHTPFSFFLSFLMTPFLVKKKNAFLKSWGPKKDYQFYYVIEHSLINTKSTLAQRMNNNTHHGWTETGPWFCPAVFQVPPQLLPVQWRKQMHKTMQPPL